MKKNVTLFFKIFILSMLMVVISFASTIKLTMNGSLIQAQAPPIQENGTILVPLRLISEELDALVSYDESTQLITISKDNTLIKLTLGSTKATCNGIPTTLSLAPKLVNGVTMVPIRFISENLDCIVDWDPTTQSITVQEKTSVLPIATLTITGLGTIQVELYPSLAPNTVNNFISLSNQKFYDGLTFHRVIDDFMIQGGCPLGNGTGGPGYSIPGEFSRNGFTDNTLSHTPGVLSMARSNMPNSAGSQFFIMTSHSSHLDGDYAAFGKVISGMEIVDQIKTLPTDIMDKPLVPIVIESIRVDTKGVTYQSPIKLP
ncbi:MAG: peptidylprolyl isomerase [Cellulosilyticaceae bacterium]